MTFDMFFQIIAAVFIGVVLAAIFLRAVMTGERMEKSGVSQNDLPWWVYLGGLLPLCFVIWQMLTLS